MGMSCTLEGTAHTSSTAKNPGTLVPKRKLEEL
jgi:hypothetical protein